MDLTGFNQRIDTIHARLIANLKVKARDYQWRIHQLKQLEKLLVDHDEEISAAMWKDMRKSKFECSATEQGVVLSEIKDALKNLQFWMQPTPVPTPLYNFPGSSKIVYDPLGLVLIIGAWNYPINLLLAPMVGAIAGGNAIILKPSELSDATAKVLAQLIPQYMDPDLIAIIEAGPEETSALLDRKFDLIFFTGSGPVGRIVLAKAAPHLTPVTLELGGKSPAIVLNDADLEVTARRLTWGKFMNAGQTCIAPDYILVQRGMKDELIKRLGKYIQQFFGDDPKQSPDYCRIINKKNFDRLSGLMKNEKVLVGGQSDAETLYIAPTVLEVDLAAPVMQQEIFGPILPVIEVQDLKEAIRIVNERDKPLALYLFTKDSEKVDRVLEKTSSGGVCINEVVMHMPEPNLPFGGVGPSGMGHYHGEFSFKTFTHAKGVLHKGTWLDLPVRYAPYTVRNMKILRWLF
jgi:aldehyde dehydrogenase (NAD+)